jgi:hypothetical protein
MITRTPRACASYPSCVAVYPRDSRSHVFYVADPIRSVHSRLQSATRQNCQADDFRAREVQGGTDAFSHEEQRTLLAHAS